METLPVEKKLSIEDYLNGVYFGTDTNVYYGAKALSGGEYKHIILLSNGEMYGSNETLSVHTDYVYTGRYGYGKVVHTELTQELFEAKETLHFAYQIAYRLAKLIDVKLCPEHLILLETGDMFVSYDIKKPQNHLGYFYFGRLGPNNVTRL
jgi:hypothetical protein